MKKYGNYNKLLADRFKQVRDNYHLTREQLAEELKCTPQLIYQMESAHRGITKQTAMIFASIYGFDANFLIDENVKYMSCIEEFNDLVNKSANYNGLTIAAIRCLASANGYKVVYNQYNSFTSDRHIKDVLSDIKETLVFYKDDVKVLSLSLAEAVNFGNNLAEICQSNFELIENLKGNNRSKP